MVDMTRAEYINATALGLAIDYHHKIFDFTPKDGAVVAKPAEILTTALDFAMFIRYNSMPRSKDNDAETDTTND